MNRQDLTLRFARASEPGRPSLFTTAGDFHRLLRGRGLPLLTAVLLAVPGTAHAAEADFADENSPSVVRAAVLSAARNALRQDDARTALFYYARYVQHYPVDLPVLQEYAGVLIQAGQIDEALRVCDQILGHDPLNPEAYKLKAVALARLGRPREALRLVQDLRIRFPDDPELQKIEAGFRAIQGDLDFSNDIYRDLLRAGFNTVGDWQDYLQLLAANGQWDLLLEAYAQYRPRLTENDAVRSAALSAHLARNEWAEAEALYADIRDVDRLRDASLLMADRLTAAGRLDEAAAFLEPLLDSPDPDPNLIVRLALLDAYRKHFVRAMGHLDTIPMEQRNDAVDIGRAKVLWAAGQRQAALDSLEQRSYPLEQLEATLARAGLLYDLEREAEMLPLLYPLLPLVRDTHSTERRLAWCLLTLAHIRMGEYDQARRFVREFTEREPGDWAPDILAVMIERAARRTQAYYTAVARLGLRLRDYRPGVELIRPALIEEVPPAAWRIAFAARPENTAVGLALADAEARDGRIKVAFDTYETVSLASPDAVQAYLGMMKGALSMSRDQYARRLAERLLEHDLRFSETIEAARILLWAGHDGLAQAFQERIPVARRDHPDAIAVQAALLLRSGREREARRQLAALDPGSPVSIGALLYSYRRFGDLARDADDVLFTEAIDRIQALAVGAHGDLPDAVLVAADLMIRVNRFDETLRLLGRYETRAAQDPRLNARLMVAFMQTGDYAAAEIHIRRLLARRPRDAGYRGLLARTSVWQSRYGQARERYQALLDDYPEDELFPLEWAAKGNRALGRHRRSIGYYDDYTGLMPEDREMVVESADAWHLMSLEKTATARYQEASWGDPESLVLQDALNTARRETHWGAGGGAAWSRRRGRDGKVDEDTRRLEGSARVPRGPDGLALRVGLGRTSFAFLEPRAERLTAHHLFLGGRWHFASGWEATGNLEGTDHQSLDSTLDADLDVGYRGLAGWKVAGIAGSEEIRDNYFTILDGLDRRWYGAYSQWQPTERVELFAQYRRLQIGAPGVEAPLPGGALIPVAERTHERNSAHEGVAESIVHLLFHPHSLRFWFNAYGYSTRKQNQMYWTPEGTFGVGQAGLHWRHHTGRRHFTASPYLFYGAYAAVSRDTEGDTSPMLKGEVGWRTRFGLAAGAEIARMWGDEYKERSFRVFAGYQF